MKVAAGIKNSFNSHEILVQTNDAAKEMKIPSKPNGFGSSINGAELLLLSLATCYCNDIYREAAKRGLSVSGVDVDVTGDFGADGEPGSNFRYKVKISSNASPAAIEDLINATDKIAEIHNTLRKGISITLDK